MFLLNCVVIVLCFIVCRASQNGNGLVTGLSCNRMYTIYDECRTKTKNKQLCCTVVVLDVLIVVVFILLTELKVYSLLIM